MRKLAIAILCLCACSASAQMIVGHPPRWVFDGAAPSAWTDPNAGDLVARYWMDPMVTNASGLVDDDVGGNDGTLLPSFAGGPVWTIEGTNENGRLEHGFDFDGNDNAIGVDSLVNNPRVDSGALSVCAWFDCDGTTTRDIFSITDTNGVENYFALLISSVDGHALMLQVLGGTLTRVDGTADLRSDGWHHICYTVTAGNAMSLYIDGIVVDTSTRSGTHAGFDIARIGEFKVDGADRFYGGLIDDVRVYNAAVSSNGVFQIFSNTHPANNIEVR